MSVHQALVCLGRAIAVALVAGSSTSHAEALRPTGSWTVNFDDSQCVASRSYGSTDHPLRLVMKSPAIGNVIQLGVTRTAERLDTRDYGGTVAFDEREPIPVTMLAFTATGSNQRAYLANLPVDTLEVLSAATNISLKAPGLNEQLSLSGMPQLLKVMNECVSDLRIVWNAGEGAEATKLQRQPKADWQPILEAHHYPGVGDARLFGGAVTVALLIDEAGKLADCTVVESSGVASLGMQACALIAERGKFWPATGADGKAAKSSILKRLDWRPSKPR